MLRPLITTCCLTLLVLGNSGQAAAHFGMLIPSEPLVLPQKKVVDLTLSFSHPFEMIGMELVRPQRFFVVSDGQETELTDSLQPTTVMGGGSWTASFAVKRPGVYQFAMIPQPYWEPAEDLSIIHYTKTVIGAFGGDEGWDQPLGLPAEIVPLTRPFGNYAGNAFTGQVLLNGKPVPSAEIEVEFYNADESLVAPSDYHVTQVVKADASGIFSFVCPRPGWWGFSALNEADYTLKNPAGEEKGVEIGAVFWIYLDEYQLK